MIKVREFKSPQLLADYIKYLCNNEAEYNNNGSGKVMAISLELLLETTGCQSIQCIAKSVLLFQKGDNIRKVLKQYHAMQGVLKTGK